MGRPVKKDVNGVQVFGTYASTNVGIRVIANIGGTIRDDVYILKQKGARSYKVIDVSDSATAQCRLVNKDSDKLSTGEMLMTGRVAADSNQATNGRRIMKLNKRLATDFNGARYKWYMADDSGSDDILLVAL
jgi:hypothetical protein